MTEPVAVVGLGPVGAALALLLARSNVPVTVIERDRDVSPVSRAVALDDEALRVLQAAGLDPAAGELLTGQAVRVRASNGATLAELPPRLAATGHPALAFFHQPDLERALRAELARLPHVTLLLGHELEAFREHADGLNLTLRDRHSGSRRALQASWLLGCDGAASAVRRQLGIRLRGLTFARRWLVVDVVRAAAGPPDAPFEFICDPARPVVSAPLPGGRQRWEFMVLPGESPSELEQPAAVRQLLAPFADVADLQILRATIYTFHARVAQRWRDGRVLLAGDAAHLMPPFAGQGLSSGLGDAHNLAWKIAAAFHRSAPCELLDSYEAERRPHVTRLVALSVLLGAAIQTRRPRLASARDAAVRGLLAAPGVHPWITAGGWKPSRYKRGSLDSRSRSPVTGRQLPQPTVRLPSGTTRRLDDVLGPSFALIGSGTDSIPALDADSRSKLERLPARLVQVTSRRAAADAPPAACQVEDPSGDLDDWLRRFGATLVLVRPDRHVYAALNPVNVAEVAAELTRALTGGIASG